MKQYMTTPVMTDEAAQYPIGALLASPAGAAVAPAAMEHTAPTGPVQATGQKPRHGEGE
jgi:hypothetical protein